MEMADEQEEGALQHGIQIRRGASDGGLRERQWSGEGVGGSSEVSLPLAGKPGGNLGKPGETWGRKPGDR
jgi:hypothetical protein